MSADLVGHPINNDPLFPETDNFLKSRISMINSPGIRQTYDFLLGKA